LASAKSTISSAGAQFHVVGDGRTTDSLSAFSVVTDVK
jgi:hypothetical protein